MVTTVLSVSMTTTILFALYCFSMATEEKRSGSVTANRRSDKTSFVRVVTADFGWSAFGFTQKLLETVVTQKGIKLINNSCSWLKYLRRWRGGRRR